MKSYNIQIGDYVYFTKAINEEEAKEKAIKLHTERRRKLVSDIYVEEEKWTILQITSICPTVIWPSSQ